LAKRAADDLLHFAFMQVNARTEHVRKLKFHGRSSKSQVDWEEQSGGSGCVRKFEGCPLSVSLHNRSHL
jgi:hypothetical protein